MGAVRWAVSGVALILLVLGVWIASSIAALRGAPREWVFAAGALCFPVLPGLWALLGARARGRRMRLWDLMLRAAALNLVFVAGLLALRPQVAFVAVSTRGDWFLDGASSAEAEGLRGVVHDAAEGLGWVYARWADNPYADAAPTRDLAPEAPPKPGKVAVSGPRPAPRRGATPSPRPPPAPSRPEAAPSRTPPPVPDGRRPAPSAPPVEVPPSPVAPPTPVGRDSDAAPDDEALVLTNRDGELRWREGGAPEAGLSLVPAAPRRAPPSSPRGEAAPPVAPAPEAADGLGWPMPGGPVRASQGLPDAATRTVEGLTRYVSDRSSDPVTRLRILHDWMATHIEYDDVSIERDPVSYDPVDVLRDRKAVCSGFARVFQDVARGLGVESRYIVGRTRAPSGDLAPLGHAWNAVRLDGAWYLVDVTWDVTRWTSGKTQPFSTDYLLAPPEIFRVSHLPEEDAWQLSASPMGLAAFLRQPMSKPSFFANGLRLVSPNRPHLTARGEVEVVLENPRRRFLTVTLSRRAPTVAAPAYKPCGAPISDARPRLRCRVPRQGEHTLGLWAGSGQYGSRTLVARWQVNAE